MLHVRLQKNHSLLALSVKYPYADLFFRDGGKTTENRTYKLPLGWLAVHMSQTAFSQREVEQHGMADRVRRFDLPPFTSDTPGRGCIIGLVRVCDISLQQNDCWCMRGHFHAHIDLAIRLLKPIICRGQPDTWRLPSTVTDQIAVQLPAATPNL